MADRTNEWDALWSSSKRKRYVFVCLIVTILIALGQPLLTGQVYGEAEAIALLSSLKDSSLYFGNAIATASATILALMLTLLSMTHQMDAEFDRSVYKGIRLIGLISTITFIAAVFLLLCLSLPVGEFENIPSTWFRALYYIISTLNVFLSGLMVIGVLMLFDTITTLIKKIAP